MRSRSSTIGDFSSRFFRHQLLTEEQCAKAGHDSEATVLRFETPSGNVHLNISMHYHARRTRERSTVSSLARPTTGRVANRRWHQRARGPTLRYSVPCRNNPALGISSE